MVCFPPFLVEPFVELDSGWIRSAAFCALHTVPKDPRPITSSRKMMKSLIFLICGGLEEDARLCDEDRTDTADCGGLSDYPSLSRLSCGPGTFAYSTMVIID